uniref:Uncharacterized protein n=1 Tax=Lepeophtheirus salmonis TaxID=72036 RepID=A0A0K2UQ46_LEPSM
MSISPLNPHMAKNNQNFSNNDTADIWPAFIWPSSALNSTTALCSLRYLGDECLPQYLISKFG